MVELKFKELNISRYKEMCDWCRDQFGREALWPGQLDTDRSPAKWYTNSAYPKEMFGSARAETGKAMFKFREDKEATLFSLRWS